MLIYQYRIYRTDLQHNPNILYVFGDNMQRMGMGGQAAEMRHEPNAVGIPTKYNPTMNDMAFFYDNQYDSIVKELEEDFKILENHVKNGGIVVWPLEGIGTGLSQLPTRAPKVLEYIETKRKYIASL